MPQLDINSVRRALRSPRVVARVVIGILLAANVVAALLVFKPWTGSVSDLEREVASLRQQIRQKQSAVDRLRSIVGKVETARIDGDKFMDIYLLSGRTMASTLASDLEGVARKAGIKQRDVNSNSEPVEGSDTIRKLTITAGYEGAYADLMQFLNLLDRSPRLLIVESLQAAPQQNGLALSVTMKLTTFVREGGPAQVAMAAGEQGAQQ